MKSFPHPRPLSSRQPSKHPAVSRDGTIEPLEARIAPATIIVTDLGDNFTVDGKVTLAEAIKAANTDTSIDGSVAGSGADIITFAPALTASGPATIHLASLFAATADDRSGTGATDFGPTAFKIGTNISIQGPIGDNGITIQRDTGSAEFRLFYVTSVGSLALDHLTLTGGVAHGGNGAGSFASGGGGAGGLGGAIFSQGSLDVKNSTLSGNQAIGGNGVGPGGFVGGGTGGGGVAGAAVTGNSVSSGGTAGGGPNAGGAGVAINGGDAGFGGGGGGGGNGFNVGSGFNGGAGGFGGGGGGGGTGNGAGNSGGTAGLGGFGGGGGGGGRNQTGATAGVGAGSVFGGGLGGNGGPGNGGGGGGGGGGAGLGGAIFNAGGTVNLIDDTFSNNTAQGGNGGLIASQGAGGSGFGGGLFNLDGSLTVLNSTFADNTVTAGNNGTPGHDGGAIYSLDQHGSGLPAGTALLHIQNTIVANSVNATKDFVNNAGLVTGDHNLVESNTGVAAGVIATSADPLLGALAANGGPTKTYALKPGSPAREAGGLTDEIQKVTVGGAAGTFTLTFNGSTTATPLAFNATAAQVQTALNALPSIGGVGGSVVVAQNGNQYSVVFGGTLANLNEPAMTASGAGGATPSVATLLDGGALPAATDQRGITRSLDGDNNGTTTVDIGAFEAPNPFPTVNLVAGAGPWTVKLIGNQVEVLNNVGNVLFIESKDALTLLQINGTIADDTVIVDSSNGLVALPGVVAFDGAGGFNTLQLVQTGGATQTSDTFSVGPNAGDVRSVIVGPSGTQDVRAYHLAPVIDTVPAALLTVNGTNASNDISYTPGSVVANGLVAVDEFETIEFSNKTALTISAAGGSDTISLNNASTPTGLTGIAVNGGDPSGSDTLIVSGTTGNDTFGYTPSSTVGSGSVTRMGAPTVTFATVEQLHIDGQGGTDTLTFTDTTGRRVTYTPGSAPDSGLIEAAAFGAGTGVVPLSFAHIGAIGSVTFTGTGDILQINGTNNSDTFNLTGSTAQITNTTAGFTSVLLNLSNIFSAELRGFDGSDTFNVTGSLAAITGGVVIDGGSGSPDDTANLSGATGAVNVTMGTTPSVTGYGATVSLTGVELLNANATSQDATFTGTAGDDTITVTPTGTDAATFAVTSSSPAVTSSSPVVNFTNAGTMTASGGAGTNALVFTGRQSGDFIKVSRTAADFSIALANAQTITPTATFASWTINTVGVGNSLELDDQGAAPAKLVDLILNGNAEHSAALNFISPSDTFYTALDAHTELLGNDHGSIRLTDFGGLDVQFATAGTTADIGATDQADFISLTGAGSTGVVALINGHSTLFEGLLDTVNVYTGNGDDTVFVQPNDFAPTGGIFIEGDGPVQTDHLTIVGTDNADTFTYAGTTPTDGSVAIMGKATVSYEGIGNVTIDGLAGADTFKLASDRGRVKVTGGEGSDTIDFTGATAGVTFDLDAVGEDQHVNATGEIVTLGDVIENFTGTAFNDILHVKAATSARTLNGGVQATLPPGDTLVFDGNAAVVNLVPVDTNTGTFKTIGYANVTFGEFETNSIINSPSGPGGFGLPGNSNAFSTAHIYDLTQAKIAGKPAPGKGPTAVVTGDLNGDGFADMVVVNSKSKNISILINKGDGTFADSVSVPTPATGPQDVVLGKFDADTNLDAIVSFPDAGKIALYKGDGAGGFLAPVLIPAAAKFKPAALTVGFMNADLNLDVIATSKGTGLVGVLFGDGLGGFTPGTPVKATGASLVDVVVGDFNKDTFLDVAAADPATNSVRFFAGSLTGALAAPERFAAGLRPSALAVGDLNNDGRLDLAISNSVSRFVSVLIAQGAGPQFAPQLRIAVPGLHQSTAIAIGDFDGDGIADLGLGNRAGSNFTVLRGLGAAAYSQPYEFNLGKDPAFAATGGIALADLNNDGLLDIVATSLGSHDARVMLRKI